MAEDHFDILKFRILEAQCQQGLTAGDMAALIGVGRTKYFELMKEDTSEWLTEAVMLAKALKIPIDKIREAID